MADLKYLQLLDELKELYRGLYNDEEALEYFLDMLKRNAEERRTSLREIDALRMNDKDWYKSDKLLGMMLYAQNFGGNLREIRNHLPYLEECGINYLHLMPLLDSVKGKSDGGYAVSDFRKVRPKLGTMEDLESLAEACHEKGISLCFDFVLNHTSEEHAWAKAARAGDKTAQDRFFVYDSWDIPNQFEQTVPQVFPTTAPGNFTWCDEMQKVVMTTFHEYQWDLNYANPMVFNDMTDNLLYLANRGMDVIRLDAIPYIWKQLGTNCRNLPQVHTLVRMMHLACQLVCPGVALLGEVVMEPRQVVPYFGPEDRPECDMLYNVTTMCTTWHTLATRDVRLLQYQMEQVCRLPENCFFQNYLRCHDDIGWGLDYGFLGQFGIGEESHKRYLNDWFTGKWPGSWSRGELYNDAESLGDARTCGTTASLSGLECGILEALDNKGDASLRRGLNCDLMLHAWMFSQTGIPVIYSGDEIGQLNDYSYHDNPDHYDDSRYVHRGKFDFELAEKRFEPGTMQQIIFDGLQELKNVRAEHDVFRSDAEVYVFYTGDNRVMGLLRRYGEQNLVCLFNFSEQPAGAMLYGTAWKDILTGDEIRASNEGRLSLQMDGYEFRWLMEV
ncbi:MAG: alpha-amylase family glycosyl hydrolase [Bacillota bacterium]